MAESVLDIIFRTKKTGAGEKEAAGGMTKLKQGFESLTGVSLTSAGVVAAAGAAIAIAANEAKKAVSEYSAYVESIDKLSMATGMSADQTSRLVQLADDFRVSQEGLEGAMKLALQNGFEPTIDNLAKLSDEYLAIQSPTERAKTLQELFGKSWQQMVPMLERGGDAIREAGSEIDDSLVVTKKSIEQNREYQAAVDDLGDAWTGVKNALAEDALPAITDVTEALAEGVEAINLAKRGLEQGRGFIEGYGYSAGLAAYEQQKFEQHTREVNDALIAQYEAGQTGKQGIDEVGLAAQGTIEPLTEMEVTMRLASGAAQAAGQGSRELADAAIALATAEDNLKVAQDNLATAQDNWRKGSGGQIAGMLEATGLAGDKLYLAIDAADEIMGTNEGTAMRQKDAMQKLVDQYKRTGDIDAFKQGLLDLEATFMPLDESVKSSTKLVETLQEKLDDLERTYNIRVKTTYEDSGRPGGGGGGSSEDCFLAGTPVTTPGGLRAIESLKPGENVLVLLPGSILQEAVIEKTIVSRRADVVTVALSDGQRISCSPNHPWQLWGGGWCWAEHLPVGARLVSDHGEVWVVEVDHLEGMYLVYNLTIDHPAHTFMVGGVVVHNVELKADGGPVRSGRTYLVGEEGPEILDLGPSGRAGRVIPNEQSQSMLGGPLIGELHIHNGMDVQQVIYEINRRSRRG